MKKIVFAVFALTFCQVIFAALPPMSKSQLLMSSTDVVYGKIRTQTSSERDIFRGKEITYSSEVEVLFWDKARNVEEGEVITVTHRRIMRDMPGPVGQNLNPAAGDHGTFHLRIRDDGTYFILEPNGFDNEQRHGSGELGDVCSEM